MKQRIARGKKPRVSDPEEGYPPRRCVEGFAIRIRKTQKAGGSVLVTGGQDRLEAYATGIEAFLAEHDALVTRLEEAERVIRMALESSGGCTCGACNAARRWLEEGQ